MITRALAISFILFLLITPCLSDGGWEVLSSGYGGATGGSYTSISEYSTNLQRFNQTDGYYQMDASRTSYLTTGLSSHLFTNKDNCNINGSLKLQSADAYLASDVVSMHEDNTNVPGTLCDTGDLTQPTGSLINATNNTSSNVFRASGIVPMSQNAVASYTIMGQGTDDDPGIYESTRSLEGSNISLSYDTDSPKGNSFQTVSSYIASGQNRKEKVEQFHQYTQSDTIMASDESEGIKQHAVLNFVGHKYDGPNMPDTWEAQNTTNATANSTVNQTVNSTVVNAEAI